MKYFLQSKSKSTFQLKSCTTLTNNFSKCRSMKRLLQMEMQACKHQVDEINDHQLGLKQAYESIDSENQSLNISFWISSFCLVLKTESIEALILKLANQRIFHKLQSFIENIQKIDVIVETVKKEKPEKIMDLFQKITTLFASTLNQAQIFKIKENIRVFCRIRCGETMSVEFLSECTQDTCISLGRDQLASETKTQSVLITFLSLVQPKKKKCLRVPNNLSHHFWMVITFVFLLSIFVVCLFVKCVEQEGIYI
ncbi:hypothetical protein RFI_03869 [Reticulomyxa filosa]|uniref:Transmembrane protein n=1 Tax=Reticulomyxa filosa TaxID=46433 RepID=X6P576_RETFI|nr:hypothetical protein RFI_03869 [Reticulomyxa filosa]|eukprot:ETO33239.1 hypothetical protein RFI_03869 [Reticulomyxa filosa]